MSQSEAFFIETLSKTLGEAFASPDIPSPPPAASVPVGEAEFEKRLWFVQTFNNLQSFQLFVGLQPAEEAAQPVNESVMELLGGNFTKFAGLFSKAAGQQLESLPLEGSNPTPDLISHIFLIKDAGIRGGVAVAISSPALQWLTKEVSPTKPVRTPFSGSPVLDALMDVELPMSILLGSKEVPLSEVMQWGPGAIVEFDTGLKEPVDVIVNGQVVARGSVVLVDGNYGVRVDAVIAATGMTRAA